MGYTIRTISYTGQRGTALTIDMMEASNMTKGPAGFKIWRECPVCALDYPEEKMTRIAGKWYCIPNGCFRDTDHRWK